jgi:hypothetical protein
VTDTDCPPTARCALELAVAAAADSDGDELPDPFDNCPEVPNANQRDGDGNGVGDACGPATATTTTTTTTPAASSTTTTAAVSTTSTTLPALGAVVDLLAAALPDPAATTGRARRIAKKLAKLEHRVRRKIEKGLEAGGDKQDRLYGKARKQLKKLREIARRADQNGTLGVPLQPIEDAVALLMERLRS